MFRIIFFCTFFLLLSCSEPKPRALFRTAIYCPSSVPLYEARRNILETYKTLDKCYLYAIGDPSYIEALNNILPITLDNKGSVSFESGWEDFGSSETPLFVIRSDCALRAAPHSVIKRLRGRSLSISDKDISAAVIFSREICPTLPSSPPKAPIGFTSESIESLAYELSLLYAKKKKSLPKYVSEETFHFISDIEYDPWSFTISSAFSGCVIFVKTDFLGQFTKEVHPQLPPYVLITHGSDLSPSEYTILEDPHLLGWFALNATYSHKKLYQIPIGIASSIWPHGNQRIIETIANSSRKRLPTIYLNFSISTAPSDRKKAFEYFYNHPLAVIAPPTKKFREYLLDLKGCSYVISPKGNGIDCHRTWEALVMGATPVLLSSALDPLYEKAGCVILPYWEAPITPPKIHSPELIFSEYWLEYIKSKIAK